MCRISKNLFCFLRISVEQKTTQGKKPRDYKVFLIKCVETQTFTHSHLGSNSDSPVHHLKCFCELGQKTENPEETHTRSSAWNQEPCEMVKLLAVLLR